MLIRFHLKYVSRSNLKYFISIVIVLLILCLIVYYINTLYPYKKCIHHSNVYLQKLSDVIIPDISSNTIKSKGCTYYDCFNAYKCGYNGEQRIRIYVYPFTNYLYENDTNIFGRISKEYYEVLRSIRKSSYHTNNPEEACVFVPSVDTLIYDKMKFKALSTLPYWNNGENHLIFQMITLYDFSQNAMIAAAAFNSWTYRTNFDISIPVFSPSNEKLENKLRTWLVIFPQGNTNNNHENKLIRLSNVDSDLYILNSCHNKTSRCHKNVTYSYPNILQDGIFCLILRDARMLSILSESLSSGCIPIIAVDSVVMPFHEVVDWKRAALFVPEGYIESIMDFVRSISIDRRYEMSLQGIWIYRKYFSSIQLITNTVLDILNQRVFPQNGQFYEYWNLSPDIMKSTPPLFLRTEISRDKGFTAVVLAYDRIDSLFQVIRKLSLVPNLSMILVIWNNVKKSPPQSHLWPKITKTLKLIRSNENKLSNRFFPYDEIETDAILSLDDDIDMLTADELDFGFEVWTQFPDRIVGFPSRTHVWDNFSSSWKYESEWKNEISMILTGAAFFHKYYTYLYTTGMPGNIKELVDKKMNCEDIAMNFLITNVTNKAPIKVTPRKKFKCPECVNTEMLSADASYMMERSNCINEFTRIYGRMILKTVEFRADPVLYKDNLPDKLKKYKNIGTL